MTSGSLEGRIQAMIKRIEDLNAQRDELRAVCTAPEYNVLSETLLQGQDLSDCALSGLRCLPEALRGVTLDPMQMTELAGIFGIHIKK